MATPYYLQRLQFNNKPIPSYDEGFGRNIANQGFIRHFCICEMMGSGEFDGSFSTVAFSFANIAKQANEGVLQYWSVQTSGPDMFVIGDFNNH